MITARWLTTYMHMVIHRRLIFCLVPRVASTSWVATFRDAAGLPDLGEGDRIQDPRTNGLHYLHRHKAPVRYLYLNNPAGFRAVFVRNPWTRVLSAYRSKIEAVEGRDRSDRHNRYILETIDAAKAHCRTHGKLESDEPGPTFGEFLSFLEDTPPEEMNAHWQPQTIVASMDKIHYHFVGRFENMEQDSNRLIRRFGLQAVPMTSLTRKTKSSEQEILARYYTPERLSQVGRIYEKDIAFFGYEQPQI